MKNGKLGFIGIGNMASAIIGGILSSWHFPGRGYLYVQSARGKNAALYRIRLRSLYSAEEVAELCDTVFLCVKPQIFPEVLRVIAPTVAKKNADDIVIVSIAAGVTFKNLQDALGADRRYVRACRTRRCCSVRALRRCAGQAMCRKKTLRACVPLSPAAVSRRRLTKRR